MIFANTTLRTSGFLARQALLVTASTACEAAAHLESSYGGDDLGTLGLAGSTLVTRVVIKYACLPPAPQPPGGTQEGARHLPRQAVAVWQCGTLLVHPTRVLGRAPTFPVIHSLWSTMGPECCRPSHTRTCREITHRVKPKPRGGPVDHGDYDLMRNHQN